MITKLLAAAFGMALVIGANVGLHVEMRKTYAAAHMHGVLVGYTHGLRLGREQGKEAALDVMGDMLLMRDADQNCIAVNPTQHRVVGKWPQRPDGNCHLADWRALQAALAAK